MKKREGTSLFKKQENVITGVTIALLLLVVFFSTYQPSTFQNLTDGFLATLKGDGYGYGEPQLCFEDFDCIGQDINCPEGQIPFCDAEQSSAGTCDCKDIPIDNPDDPETNSCGECYTKTTCDPNNPYGKCYTPVTSEEDSEDEALLQEKPNLESIAQTFITIDEIGNSPFNLLAQSLPDNSIGKVARFATNTGTTRTVLKTVSGTTDNEPLVKIIVVTDPPVCGGCRIYEPILNKLKNKYPIEILHPQSEKGKKWDQGLIPSTAFVDKDEKLLERRIGPIYDLEAIYNRLLNQEAQKQNPIKEQPPKEKDFCSDSKNDGGECNCPGEVIGGQKYISDDGKVDDNELISVNVKITAKGRDSSGEFNDISSGTFIDTREGRALILTCDHAFRGSEQGTIDLSGTNGEESIPFHIEFKDSSTDVALISIKLPEGTSITPAKLVPRDYVPKFNDEIKTTGCSHSALCTIEKGKITKTGFVKSITTSAYNVVGRSGGGLFSDMGKVMGVCNAIDPETGDGIFRTPQVIYDTLEKAGLSSIYNQQPTTPSNKECACQGGACSEKEEPKPPTILPEPEDKISKDCPNPLPLPEPNPVIPNPPISSSVGDGKWDDCTANVCKADTNGDGKFSKEELDTFDSDEDGVPDYKEDILVVTEDGLGNDFLDTDGDGKPDVCDKDDDGDGTLTKDELEDKNNDGNSDYLDKDYSPNKPLKIKQLPMVPVCEPIPDDDPNKPEDCPPQKPQTLPQGGLPIEVLQDSDNQGECVHIDLSK